MLRQTLENGKWGFNWWIKNLSIGRLSLRNLPHLLLALARKVFPLLLLQHKLLQKKDK